jgi:hypothetical protein
MTVGITGKLHRQNVETKPTVRMSTGSIKPIPTTERKTIFNALAQFHKRQEKGEEKPQVNAERYIDKVSSTKNKKRAIDTEEEILVFFYHIDPS